MLQDLIKACVDIPPPVMVPTPEWPEVDRQIHVVRGTTASIADFWQWFSKAPDNATLAPYVAIDFAREADGVTPIFDRDAIEWLTTKAGSALSRIFEAADALNYFSGASREELRKNYEAPGATASTSS